MADLTIQTIVRTGLNPSFSAAAAGGDTLTNDGRTFLHVKNGDASEHTVTIASRVTNAPAGTTVSNLAVAVPAGGERLIGPLQKSAFNNAQNKVSLSYDAVTSVTIAAVKLP